jgi:hypothetical protein
MNPVTLLHRLASLRLGLAAPALAATALCTLPEIAHAGQKPQAAAPSQSKLQLPPGVRFIKKGTFIPGTPEAYKFQFENGLRVILLPDHRNPIAMLRLHLDAGSNRETRGQTGLAHFFEHMMFRKTKGQPEGEYDRVLSSIGGKGNAGTSTDMVVYYSTFPAAALETMLDLESRRFQNLELVDPWFSTEKGAVIAERGLNYDNNPRNRAREILTALVERGTPYEWLTIGAKADVQNMQADAVRNFYATYYVPGNTVLTLGGAIELEPALVQIHKAFGSWKRGDLPGHSALPSDYLARNKGKEYVCSEDVNEQSYTVTYPSLHNSFRDQVLSAAFEIALNNHPEGTLEYRLLKEKLATGAAIGKRIWQRTAQPIDLYLTLSRDQKLPAARLFWQKAVDEVLRRPVDERFRKRVLKNFTVDDAEHSLRMTTLAEDFEDFEARYGDITIGTDEKRIIQNLTTKEFHTWIRENLNHESTYTTGVVPDGLATPCAQLSANPAK